MRVALFKTASDDASLQTLAGAIDPVLLSELSNVPNLQIAARPALDLPSMQLAIYCVGETVECLSLASKEAQADGLIAPLVRKLGAELVVTLLLHDARAQTAIRAATRRYQGDTANDQALDGIPAMVRELFDLSPPPSAAAAPEPVVPVATTPEPSNELPPPAAAKPLPIVPIVLGAVGVAFIGAGIGVGAASHGAENDYAKIHVTDEASASSADKKYSSAKTEAAIADVGIGVGVAAIIAGAVLLIVENGSGERAPSADSAHLNFATKAGRFTLSGHWD
ncbi:MAG TPA: hypothetical protein VGI70_06520 [Polyangiales bacterium]